MWALRLRCFALLGAAALGLHELRYLLAYGEHSGAALYAQGHAYLDAAGALVALSLVAALAVLIGALLRGRGAVAARRFRARWVTASAALLGVYAVQELVEGALSAGHPDGLAGVFGHGGWIAVPLALLLGAVVAALLRGADVVLARFAAASRRRVPRAPRRIRQRAPLAVRPRLVAALAGPGAGRAPPSSGR